MCSNHSTTNYHSNKYYVVNDPSFFPSILLFVVVILHLGMVSWIRSDFFLDYWWQEMKK